MDANAPVQVLLHGAQWIVHRASRMRKKWGECNWTDRVLKIHRGAKKAKREREIAIHEALHAIFPFIGEDYIDAAAVELDDYLEALEL